MAKAKSFKSEMATQPINPAATYITTPSAPPAIAADDEHEFKSKRFNLLIKPSTHAAIEKIAAMKRESVNNLINKILEAYADDNKALVAKYDETFGEEG